MEDWLKEIDNYNVMTSFLKAKAIVAKHSNIAVSVSGGSDSDVMLDLIERVRGEKKIRYIFFNTGVEYQATKDHLGYLEKRYGIQIEKINAKKPIPTCCREFGQPFLSKRVSEMIMRLQGAGFQWEDDDFETLVERYPNCKEALRWWCNGSEAKFHGTSMFNIDHNRRLKEFMMLNPPEFKISNLCCTYAKKKVAKDFNKDNDIDLSCIGVRRAEGGIRAVAYQTCFSEGKDGAPDHFRPIYFYTEEDKRYYEQHFGIVHSDCYTKYGFSRTGCCGCPYGLYMDRELDAMEVYEPKLYKFCNNMFRESYDYTRRFREFQKLKRYENKADKEQFSMFDSDI